MLPDDGGTAPPVEPIPPVPAPAAAPPPQKQAQAPAPRSQEPVAEAPWSTQIPKALRGDDMLTWGSTWEDMIGNVRSAFRENQELKSRVGEITKGVPEKAEDYTFTISEEAKPYVNAEDLKSFQALAKSFNLTTAAAQKLVEFESNRALAARKAYEDYVAAKRKEAMEGLRAEYKDKTEAVIAAALATVEALGGKALRDEMEKSAIGNNPLLIRAFIKASEHYTERGPGTNPAAGTGQGSVTEVDLKAIYPKSAKAMGLR